MTEVPKIVAVVATYKRDDCLKRLFEALEQQTLQIYAVVIADNAASEETRKLVMQSYRFKTEYICLPENPGCGAGLASAMEYASELWGQQVTYCVFDDDAVPEEDSIELLYDGMMDERGWAAAPILIGHNGIRDHGPQVRPHSLHQKLKVESSPEQVLRVLGDRRPEFEWCKGPAMMVTSQAIEKCGLHRIDMWMLGEDIEYSMRLSQFGRCIFVPASRVHHLPPKQEAPNDRSIPHQIKFLSMLQNLAFMGVCLPHASKCLHYMPSHILRYMNTFRSVSGIMYMARAIWNGMVLREPAGATSGQRLRELVRSSN